MDKPISFNGKTLEVGMMVIAALGKGTVALEQGKIVEVNGLRVKIEISFEGHETLILDRYCEGVYVP